MNAMPAVPPPGDGEMPPRHLRLVQDVPPRTPSPGLAADGTPAPARPVGSAPPRPARNAPLRPAQDAPLRLTRRGRIVLVAVAALAVAVLSLLAASAAQAANHSVPSRQSMVHVVVRPGQSLWSVAESADPDQDTRLVVKQIIDLNSLAGDTVFAGQQLWVPRG